MSRSRRLVQAGLGRRRSVDVKKKGSARKVQKILYEVGVKEESYGLKNLRT